MTTLGFAARHVVSRESDLWSLLDKLYLRDRVHAVILAYEAGLVER